MATKEMIEAAVEAYLAARENPRTDCREAITRALEAAERTRCGSVIRQRKIIQLALNQTQMFALCDDGSVWLLDDAHATWLPFKVKVVETAPSDQIVFRDE